MMILRAVTAGAAALLVAGTATAQQTSTTFDTIKARGVVNCGVSTGLAGFSLANSQGVWTGLDVDVCRAVAAAMFGDANKVKFAALSAQQRFTALQSGEVDLLSRNTTWTLSRDTSLGLDFAAISFFDGQGFMVPKKLNVKSAKELAGATICVQPGTTTELNLADYFRANNLKFTPVVIERLEEVNAAYFSGRCDVYTTDISGLAAIRASQAPVPSDHVILPEVISKEPLGPAVRHGDQKWADLVRWSYYAMLEAEEMGISSKNIDAQGSSKDPNVQRFIGAQGEYGKMLGVDAKWSYNIIKQVGNYAEVFEKHITPLGIERGVNKLWKDGGLQYSPPLR